MSDMPFIHLRTRSPYSLLEGSLRIKDMVRLCRQYEMPAIALTDTNNLFGALEFSEVMAGEAIQPICGVTLSVRLEEVRAGERAEPDGTLVLLAQDETGYANLMALSSKAYLEVGPTEPAHVPFESVLALNAGLICLTGGPDGALNRLLAEGRDGPALDLLSRLHEAFGDRLYVELQRHGRPEELKAEAVLVREAYARALPLVATNEAYFPEPKDYQAHDALLCIAGGTYVTVDDRRKLTPEHDFKSPGAMAGLFKDLPEAIENTIEIARRCSYRPVTRDPILPRFPSEGDRDEAEELRVRAREGLDARLSKVAPSAEREVYDQRLEHELSIIEGMGFPGYFLIVSDFIQWAKAHDIPVGPGRGSGAGSLVAWVLTITDLDPLRFGLLFERFLNPERVSMPDFDIDFCQERRGEVIRYVKDRYGADRVAQIITFGSLQARAVVRDVGRVLQLPFPVVDRIAKQIPNNPAQPVTLAEAVESEAKLGQMRREDEAVDRLITVALQLEGLLRNASTHAAGVVIGDRPLTELVPLYQDPRSELPATQFNMKWVEPAGLVKFDFLGLKTLTVIARAIKYIEGDGGGVIDMDTLGFDDPATYELLASGGSIGVFQLESSGMRDTLKKLKPDTIEDVIALISLYRPGPMKNIDVYVDRKFGRAEPDYLHPDLERVLKETYGVIIYQEQVMQIAQILSGYSLGEADLLRRAMGKKKKEEMDQQRVRFKQGAAEKGVDEAKADFIFDLVAEFAGYGFNKSHAAAYALIAYRTGWLKANHPVAFMAALMSLDITNTDKLAVFFQETRRMAISVEAPDVNASRADFSVEGGRILYALGAVRNVGFAAMEHVVAVREAGGPFQDLFDFAERVDPRQVNKRAFENLARSGAFDSLEPDRAKAFAAAETLIALSQRAHGERESAQASLFGGPAASGDSLERPSLREPDPWDPVQRLDEELSAIGFYLSGHPLDDMRPALAKRGVSLFADLPARAAEGARAARLAGVVRRRQEKVSQRSGDKFAFLTLSDPSGEFEALVPPKILADIRDVLEPGAAVMVTAKIEDNDGEIRLIIEGAETLDPFAVEHAGDGMRVHLEDPGALDQIRSRLDRASEREGVPRGGVHIRLGLSDGQIAEVRLAGQHAIDPATRAALKQVGGVLEVETL
jgi:DNA polymerase-3 subunit alpha